MGLRLKLESVERRSGKLILGRKFTKATRDVDSYLLYS